MTGGHKHTYIHRKYPGFRREEILTLWLFSTGTKLVIPQLRRIIFIYGTKTTVEAVQHIIKETKRFESLFITSFVRKGFSHPKYILFRRSYLLTVWSIYNKTNLIINYLAYCILISGSKKPL